MSQVADSLSKRFEGRNEAILDPGLPIIEAHHDLFEGMTLAVKNGVEPVIAHQVLVSGGGRNAYIENILGPRLLKGNLASGFTLELAHKDVRLACQLGVDSGVPVFFGALCREMYQVFMNELGHGAEADMAAVAMDRRAGTSVIPVNSKGQFSEASA